MRNLNLDIVVAEAPSTVFSHFRQLMEKSREQQRNMYIAFVDFTKAFDTVNRVLLYGILGRLGCPAKFVRIIKNCIQMFMQDLSSMVNLQALLNTTAALSKAVN